MQDRELLELIERAFKLAGHPEVTNAATFDNSHTYGTKVTFADGSMGYLTVSDADGVMLSARRR